MSYDSEVLADSPLVYLILDEASGTAMADSSGNGRTATKAGSPAMHQTKVMPTGTFSIELNATTELITIADAAWMDAASFTVEAWVKCATVSSLHAVVGRDGTAGARGWGMYVRDGLLQTTNPTVAGAIAIATATSYHIVTTYDAATTTIRLYVNGAADTVSVQAVTTSLANALRIGTSLAGSGSNSFTLNGNIERVAMYDTALSAARVLAHYTAGISTYTGTATADETPGGTSAGAVGKTGDATAAETVGGASAGGVGVQTGASAAETAGASTDGSTGRMGDASAATTNGGDAAGAVVAGLSGDASGAHTSGATGDGVTATSSGATAAETVGGTAAGVANATSGATGAHTSGGTAAGATTATTGATGAHTSGATATGAVNAPSGATGAHTAGGTAAGTVDTGGGSTIRFADGTTLINPRYADGTTLIVRGWLDADGVTIHPFT